MTAMLVIACALLLLVWFVALADLIGNTELDPTGRVILALALILVMPLGVVLWVVVRGGRAGKYVGAALLALAVGIGIGIATLNGPPGPRAVSAPGPVRLIR